MKTLKIVLLVVAMAAFIYAGNTYAQELLNTGNDLVVKLNAGAIGAASSILNEENDSSMGGIKALKGVSKFGFSLLGARKGVALNTAPLQQRLPVISSPVTQTLPVDYYKLVSPATRFVEYEYDAGVTYPSRIVEILLNGERATVCEIAILGMHQINPITGETIVSEMTFLTYYMDDGSTLLVRFGGRPDFDALIQSASITEGVYYNLNGGTKITKVYNEYDLNGNRTFGIMMTTYFDEMGTIIKKEVVKERAYYDAAGNLISKFTTFETDGILTKVIRESNIYTNGLLTKSIIVTFIYDANGGPMRRIVEERVFVAHLSVKQHTLKEYLGSVLVYALKEDAEYKWIGDGMVMHSVVAHRVREITQFDDNGAMIWYSKEGEDNIYDDNDKLIQKKTFYIYATPAERYEYSDTVDYTYDADGDIVNEHEVISNAQNGNITVTDRNRTIAYQLINGVKRIIMDSDVAITERDINGDGALERSCVVVKRSYHAYDSATGALLQEQYIRIERTWGDGYIATIYQENKIKDYDLQGNVIHEVVGTRSHYYNNDGTIDSAYDTKEIDYTYGLVNGENKLLSKHITRTVSSGSGRQDEGVVRLKITLQFEADVTYNYDPATGKLAYVHTYGKETREDGNIREVDIDEAYDANGNLVLYAVIAYQNGELQQLDLIDRFYDDRGVLREELKHFENFAGAYFIDEYSLFNEKGSLVSKVMQDSNGMSHSEEREYFEDGLTLKKVDIVSYTPWFGWDSLYPVHIPFSENRWWVEYLSWADKDDFPGEIELSFPGRYEIHEEYLRDGKITHKETLNEVTSPFRGYSYSHIVEDWEYSRTGDALHYKKEAEYVGNGWWYGLSYNYTETVERFYNLITGKIMKETYVINGQMGDFYYWIGDKKHKLFGDEKEWVPEDVQNFLDEITIRYMNQSAGHSEMSLEYVYNDDGSLASVKIHWTQGPNEMETSFVFDATIFVDKNGKIKAIEVSEGGEIVEEVWEILPQPIEVILPERDPKFLRDQLQVVSEEGDDPDAVQDWSAGQMRRPEDYTFVQKEMEDKFAALEQKAIASSCPQGVTIVGELAGKEAEYSKQ